MGVLVATAGRADDRRDEVLVDLERDALERGLRAVQRVEILDLEHRLEPLLRRQRPRSVSTRTAGSMLLDSVIVSVTAGTSQAYAWCGLRTSAPQDWLRG